MAKNYVDIASSDARHTAEVKRLYDLASTGVVRIKVEPWSEQQLEEARQRANGDLAYYNYRFGSESESDDMARQFADNAKLRTPADIIPDAALAVAMGVIEARQNGKSVGITGFTRGDEWTSKYDVEGSARDAQRKLKDFLEANGFVIATTTKHLDKDTAPLQVMAYEPAEVASN